MSYRYTAKLENTYLNVMDVNVDRNNSVVVNEIPYSPNNRVYGNGAKTREHTIRCVFMDNPPLEDGWDVSNGSIPTFEEHFGLMDEVNLSTQHQLVHPIYGEMFGVVRDFSVVYNERINYAEITFTFVEQNTQQNIITVEPVEGNNTKSFRDQCTKTTSDIELESESFLNINEWEANTRKTIAKLQSYYNQVEVVANRITNTVDYATGLGGDLLFEINSCAERMIESFRQIVNSPANFINNIIAGARQIASTIDSWDQNKVKIMLASRIAVEASITFVEDEKNRDVARQLEDTETWDINGNRLNETKIPEVMTFNDLENTLYSLRELINEAYVLDRGNFDLQLQANSLQKYVDQVKIKREVVETININNTPIATLLLQYNKSYQVIDRVLALNPKIPNPNFMTGEVNILRDIA